MLAVIHPHLLLALFGIHAGHGLANDLAITVIVGGWATRAKPDLLAARQVCRQGEAVVRARHRGAGPLRPVWYLGRGERALRAVVEAADAVTFPARQAAIARFEAYGGLG